MKLKTMKFSNRVIVIACGLLAAGAVMDGVFSSRVVTQDAAAVVGRPLTPVSAAGVARRTTRRAIYATSVYVATLPAGCSTVVINGTSIYQCGATYYQPYGTQYMVVTVQ
jgi:hypothetical protein